MNKVCIFILIFAASVALPAVAQKTVSPARLPTAETSEPIPYVNIGFQHSLVGTISETDGSFFLSTTKATDTLLVSSLGYEVARLHMVQGTTQNFEIKLVPKSIALDAVVVKPGENPAFKILRRINDHKKQNNPEKLIQLSI